MKRSTVFGRLAASLGGGACWVYLAHAWDAAWLYLLALAAIIIPWAKPVPPLPKIGDYEDD